MAKQLQLRRGTTAQHSTFTGALAEITVDTDKKVVVVHDGSTAGGFPSQKELVSGTNIKTINNASLLGSGDVAVQSTLVSGTNIKTINGASILGSGNILINTDLVNDTTPQLGGNLDLNGYDIPSKLNTTNPSIYGSITETVYNLIGTNLNPTNGTIQYKTLTSNVTFTDSLLSGQSIILRVVLTNSYTITWPTMTWITSGGNVAPILNGHSDVFVLWKEGSALFGSYSGYGA